MSFTTLPFLVLVALSVAAYYLLPQRVQWMALLAASMVFYCVGGGKTVLYVFYTAVIVYGSGLLLGRFNDLRRAAPKEEKKAITARYKPYRRAVVLVACLANFGLLYVLKYWNFTADLFQPLADQLRPGTQIPLSELVLPLGISFFMFQSVGYVIDVYRDKYAPEKNFAKLLLFVSFFPQMVQGPISRFNDLAPQLFARRSLDYTDLKYGIQLILWGYFKKMVIADRAAVLVNTVLDDPWSYSGSILAVGVLFYCIQLYGDFSGGIDITRGVARLFGIDLAENFRRPLFSTSLTDFWRRWHITLGPGCGTTSSTLSPCPSPLASWASSPEASEGQAGENSPHLPGHFPGLFCHRHLARRQLAVCGLRLLERRNHHPFPAAGPVFFALEAGPTYQRQVQRLASVPAGPHQSFGLFRPVHHPGAPVPHRGLDGEGDLSPPQPARPLERHPDDPGTRRRRLSDPLFGRGYPAAGEWYQEKRPHPSHAGTAVPLPAMGGHSVPLVVLFCFGVLRADYISSDFIYKQF
ncbi:MAG: MBOAT family O-acyltransferase [Evtepia gabavorous]